jgi:hypothetical protein
MQCPSCGATNPPSAAWCGQCLVKFGEQGAAATPVPVAAQASAAAQAPAAAASDEITPSVSAGFRRRDGEVEWECIACGEYSPLGVDLCVRCGTPFSARWADPPPAPPSATEYQRAVVWSAFVAGIGHVMLGRRTSGFTRALLYVMWLLGGVALMAAGGPVILTAGPLLAGALTVWVLTLRDLANLRNGDPEIFAGRVVIWLVSGVMGLEILGLLATSFTAGR